MRLRNLLIAVAVLALLAGGIWYANKHPKAAAPTEAESSPKVVDIPSAQIAGFEITQKGQPTVTLKRENAHWTITAPKQLAADQDTAAAMVSVLGPLTADSVAVDHPGDVSPFGLSDPSLVVKVDLKNGKTHTINFGNNLVVGSDTYTRVDSDPKIYAIATSTKSTFDKSLADLRDKRLLPFDQSKLATVEIIRPQGLIEFAKNASGDWQITKPAAYRADSMTVDDMVRKLGDAKMDTTADAAKSASLFANGSLVATVKTTGATGTQTLIVRKNKDDYYGKSDAVEGVYKLASDLGAQLAKPVDDFRNKKLFDFGFADLSKIAVENKTYTRSAADWKLGNQKVDPGSVQSFIDKARDLAATGFSNSPMPAGTNTISVTPDNKPAETVTIAKTASGYVAQRANEPTVYVLDAPTVDDLLKAAAQIKAAGK